MLIGKAPAEKFVTVYNEKSEKSHSKLSIPPYTMYDGINSVHRSCSDIRNSNCCISRLHMNVEIRADPGLLAVSTRE